MQPQAIKPNRKTSFSKIKAIELVLIGVAMVAGSFFAYQWYSHHSSPKDPYSYSYKQLITTNLPGDRSGSGMSISRPVELQTSNIDAKSNQASMFHALFGNGRPANSVEISIASVYLGSELPSDFTTKLNAMIGDASNEKHTSTLAPIKEFVTTRVATDYKVNFSEPRALTTSNIKSNAWYMTFTLSAKNKNSSLALPDMTGKVILGIGKSTLYYFKIDVLTVNWQSNQKVWDQVINSIKIDQ